MADIDDHAELKATIQEAIRIAIKYRKLTGKPLGITGEIGEFLAAEHLGLELEHARQAGYDATARDGRRVQIKARCLGERAKRSQQVGSIRLTHDWDCVVLVLMGENYEPIEMFEATREDVERELVRPGSKARNHRGALAVSKFKKIGKPCWSRPRP